MIRFSSTILLALLANAWAAEIHVSPDGAVRTLAAAQQSARKSKASVIVHAGTYYLTEPLVFTADDAGTSYRAAPGEQVVISGGMKLELKWESYQNGIMRAKTPPGCAIDQLFIQGKRQLMARYPNYDPNVRPYGGYIHAMRAAHWGGYHDRIECCRKHHHDHHKCNDRTFHSVKLQTSGTPVRSSRAAGAGHAGAHACPLAMTIPDPPRHGIFHASGASC